MKIDVPVKIVFEALVRVNVVGDVDMTTLKHLAEERAIDITRDKFRTGAGVSATAYPKEARFHPSGGWARSRKGRRR